MLQVLEKLRPLDQKLKYQIDKLVKTAVTGSLSKWGKLEAYAATIMKSQILYNLLVFLMFQVRMTHSVLSLIPAI